MGLNRLQLFYEKNQDFISLSANDRLVLLSNTFKHTGCICTNFILYKVGITDYPMYYTMLLLRFRMNLLQLLLNVYQFNLILI